MVSVIIPVFNRQHTLERLFASLRKVTYRPVEFIFVDNGSSDASKMLCENSVRKPLKYFPQMIPCMPSRCTVLRPVHVRHGMPD